MADVRAIHEFYAEPGAMTGAGDHRALVEALPDDVSELVRTIHGLAIYDVVASDFYGVHLGEDRRAEIHLRRFERMLDRSRAIDPRPLTESRPPDRRLACRCRGFSLLLLAPLRAKGVPARARCGFSAYLNPGSYEDHWLCEYWNADQRRWQLVDAQLDDVWMRRLNLDIDPLDVPRDQFHLASDAWLRCRRGMTEADSFGISFAGLRGLWFVAGNLVRDLAALDRMELLPWDVWGPQPNPDQRLEGDQLAFFDKLAELTHDPDASFDELRRTYHGHDGLRVPATVYNSVRERREPV